MASVGNQVDLQERAHDEQTSGAMDRTPTPFLTTLKRAGARSLLPIGMFIFAASLRYYMAGDAMDRFQELRTLLSHGALSSGKYSLIGPLFSTPLYLLGAALGSAQIGVVFYNVLLFLGGTLLLGRLLRPWLDERTLRSFQLLLLVGTMFPAAVASYYGETFTAVLVAVGLVLAVVGRRLARGAGWLATALGVANTPATAIGLVCVLLARIWRTRRLRFALVGALAAALILGESLLRRGSIFDTGYTHDTGAASILPFTTGGLLSFPLFFGLLATFLSFGKGLIFYIPGLFLPMRRRLAELGGRGATLGSIYGLWLLFVVGMVGVYAQWWGWSGDWYWGPRFYLFACIPASLALAVWTQRPSSRLWVNLLLLGMLALSVWGDLNAMIFGQSNLAICGQGSTPMSVALCQYIPVFSPLWRPVSALFQLGFTSQYAKAELSYNGSVAPTFTLFALVASLYIAYPLLRATGRQVRAIMPSRAIVWETLRRGWRW